ncbi:MAG: sulfite oxidase-like oxidoreductase [Anaerolineales bacterium]|nr:sulfite oxidase-like oxidoreductase [Anaerolineales bacterium]
MINDFQQRKAEEERLRKEGRLPPGQSLTIKFPVLHYGALPRFNPSTWTFRIWGEVEEEISWTWAEFQHLPRTKVTMDVHCVTRWSKFDTVWEGVSLKNLVEEKIIKLKPSAKYVIQHAEHGYTTNLPLKIVLQDNFLLATHYNGEPLTPDHGYPLRAIVGNIVGQDELETPYFWKGAKWLRGLEFSSKDIPGFWEKAGYHNEANVWKEERFG